MGLGPPDMTTFFSCSVLVDPGLHTTTCTCKVVLPSLAQWPVAILDLPASQQGTTTLPHVTQTLGWTRIGQPQDRVLKSSSSRSWNQIPILKMEYYSDLSGSTFSQHGESRVLGMFRRQVRLQGWPRLLEAYPVLNYNYRKGLLRIWRFTFGNMKSCFAGEQLHQNLHSIKGFIPAFELYLAIYLSLLCWLPTSF